MEQKASLKLIYKLHTSQLKKAKWNLTLPLTVAMRDYPENVVSISDSQLLRFIDELNGVVDYDVKVKSLQNRIKREKKRAKTATDLAKCRANIRSLYEQLYSLQFQPDYLCVVMDKPKDYDKAELGFKVNGISYKRFLGTNGGVKKRTITYVNVKLYDELKRRMDNGRNMNVPLVPAKLEAYQGLLCSGSTPIPEPAGIIVVKDCITHFKDNVIMINDEQAGDPVLTKVDGYEVEHNDSDGYGLMLPSYSRKVNKYLTGVDDTISGMNTRYAWTKGMVYTFDFVEFAEQVADTYEIVDVWGTKRDVRNAEVILTESMLKLWDSYDSWEDFYRNCQENHYQFSTPKITPDKLENVRNTNYQFLQSYEFTDEELQELCKPTIDEIADVLGLDYRKSLTFLAGFGLNINNVMCGELDPCIKALMIDRRLINDSYIRHKIWNMIMKRIEMAKRGAIKIDANFAMISGDPYALAQSMFGIEITGLLKAGELYHKYWIDKGATELACFRAPMTCHNNVRKLRLANTEQMAHWYQYIKTAIILNAWDTTCDAMNGSDKDGDTNMDTDNPIILKRTRNDPTIICVQRKAEKKIVEECDFISANKLAFNDDIGTVTNYVTSMFEVRAGFEKGTLEYEELTYRIMCGQLLQQNCIDRAKGIIAKSMPEYWYSIRDNLPKDGDDADTLKRKEFDLRISAAHKPYFMTYVYPRLRTRNRQYMSNNDYGAVMRFGEYGIDSISDLYSYSPKTPEMVDYLYHYEDNVTVGYNPCVVNRICWIFEKRFNNYLRKEPPAAHFDSNSLKSGEQYSRANYDSILKLHKEYQNRIINIQSNASAEKDDNDLSVRMQFDILAREFRRECEQICPNENELCDIIIDICYSKEGSKQFVWDMCGETIVTNLLKKFDGIYHYPQHTDDDEYDFTYCGERFVMVEGKMEDDDENYIE